MTAKLRGIFIDPTTQSVSEVLVDKHVDSYIAKQIGSEYIDRVVVSNDLNSGYGDDLWIDDEGALVQPNEYGYFKLGPHYFAGKGLILSFNDEGETLGTNLPVALVRETCSWPTFDELPDSMKNPTMSVSAMGPDGRPVPGTTTTHPCPVRKRGDT